MNGDIRFVVDFTALDTRLAAIEDNQGEILAGQAQILKAGKTILSTLKRLEQSTVTGFDRLNTSYEGLAGDIASLKGSAAALQTAVDTLTAGQDAAVAEGVQTALADFNTQLDTVASRFEGLDESTPPVEPAPEPPPVA